jgi:hypothetical protein
VHAFSRGQADRLLAQLQELENRSSVNRLLRPAELQLHADGTTLYREYRFTATAFRELCQLLGSGSTAFLRDVAGMSRHMNTLRDGLVDGEFACKTFNQLVDLRFPLLESYRVIRDESHRLIEGFVGSKQKTLDNLSLFRQAQLAFHEDVSEFWGGALIGRRMLLWYRHYKSLFTYHRRGDQPWQFYHGYYLCNGEARGTSVRGTSAVFMRHGVCLAPYDIYGGRLAHVGRDFHKRLDWMFGTILGKDLPVDALRAGCDSLVASPLGVAGVSEKERHARRLRFVRGLSELGVPQNLGKEVVDEAISIGLEVPLSPLVSMDSDRNLEQRTLFDVFCCLARMAHRLNTRRREVLERAAYALLLGGGFSL